MLSRSMQNEIEIFALFSNFNVINTLFEILLVYFISTQNEIMLEEPYLSFKPILLTSVK